MRAVLGRSSLMVALAAVAMAFALALGVYTSSAKAVNEDKVLVCHATSSATNPFTVILVDENSTDFEGHDDHEGDLIEGRDFPDVDITDMTDEELLEICLGAGTTTTTTTTGTTTTTSP